LARSFRRHWTTSLHPNPANKVLISFLALVSFQHFHSPIPSILQLFIEHLLSAAPTGCSSAHTDSAAGVAQWWSTCLAQPWVPSSAQKENRTGSVLKLPQFKPHSCVHFIEKGRKGREGGSWANLIPVPSQSCFEPSFMSHSPAKPWFPHL
jgi:hypothetical protein